jgi:3-oxoadipate enol-lactonase
MSAVPLAYRVDGPPDGPVLVLGGSLGTASAVWQPQMASLAATHRVVRYDHRGHGESPAPPGPYDIEDLGGDVLALLDRLELDRVDLAGLSLGGMVALWLAGHVPDRVRRLGLVCTSARPGQPEFWRQRAATVRSAGTAAVADAVVGRWFTEGFHARHPGVVAWARAMVTGTPAEGYAACCDAVATVDLDPLLPRITAPTLVIAGAMDPAFPLPHAERLVAGIAGSRLAVVDAAHLASVERPDIVTELLSGFYHGGEPA